MYCFSAGYLSQLCEPGILITNDRRSIDAAVSTLSVSAYIPHFHLTNIFNDVLFQPTNTTQSPGIEISVSHESCWPPIRSPRLRLSGNRNIDLHTEQLIHHFYHWSCSHSCSRLADLHHEQRGRIHYFFIVSSSSIYLIPLIILIQSSPRFILKSLATKEDTINICLPCFVAHCLYHPRARLSIEPPHPILSRHINSGSRSI